MTHTQHKREVFWQITLPLVFGILLVLAAVAAIIYSAIQPVTDLERWAGVSLIWIILPNLFFALIMLVIVIALVYAISMLIKIIPRYAYKLQHFFELVKGKASQLTNLMVEPILRLHSISAAARRAAGLGRKDPGS